MQRGVHQEISQAFAERFSGARFIKVFGNENKDMTVLCRDELKVRSPPRHSASSANTRTGSHAHGSQPREVRGDARELAGGLVGYGSERQFEDPVETRRRVWGRHGDLLRDGGDAEKRTDDARLGVGVAKSAAICSGEGHASDPLAVVRFISSGASCNTQQRDWKIKRDVLVARECVHACRRL